MRAFIAEGQSVFNRLAALKIPTVAAIHGACAGGGYEITLACDYRVASDDPATRIGLPETTLGLIPAWGGATRLPRLIGAELAAEVISKGKLYPAKEALRLGLVDEVALPADLLDIARRKILEGKRESTAEAVVTPQRPSDSDELAFPAPGTNQAPARALDVIRRGLAGSIDESLALEVDAIVELGRNRIDAQPDSQFFPR